MGTATEQSLRNILAELESDTLPTDAATETTLALCLTALQLIDDLRNALGSVNTDDLQVDVKTSALPTGAATAAMQTSCLEVLVLISALRNALYTVGTNKLLVSVLDSALPTDAATETTLALALTELTALLTELKLKADLTETQPVSIATMPTTTVQATGGDKLFGYESAVHNLTYNTSLATGTNTLDSTAVPTGKVWVLTNIMFEYTGTVPTEVNINIRSASYNYYVFNILAPVSGQWHSRQGWWVLGAGTVIRAIVDGATLNDDLILSCNGYQMDAPS